MGDIGGAFKFLVIVAGFGLAFVTSIIVTGVVAIFAPVSMLYAIGIALIFATISSILISAKIQ